MKIVVMEVYWYVEGEGEGVLLVVFVLFNEKVECNDYEIVILCLGSLIFIYLMDGMFDLFILVLVSECLLVVLVFFVFCIMVGFGMLMLVLVWVLVF